MVLLRTCASGEIKLNSPGRTEQTVHSKPIFRRRLANLRSLEIHRANQRHFDAIESVGFDLRKQVKMLRAKVAVHKNVFTPNFIFAPILIS